MKVCKLEINNFRGVKVAHLYFDHHNLLVGKNNIGKSTICEALDLVLGPDRLNKINPIDEYDFYNGEYYSEIGENPQIVIDVYLIDMSTELKSVFGSHLTFWNLREKRLLGIGEIDEVDDKEVDDCLHLRFIGRYEPEEDEFLANTYYVDTEGNEDDDQLKEVYKSKKRLIGFLYLRALRTGRRALSLERGTLLDILMRVGELRPKFWEDTRNKLKNLNPPLEDDIGALRTVLDGLEERIGLYIPLPNENSATSLHVSQLTREHLRQTLSFFVKTTKNQTPVPFQRLGTGTLSTLVFAMLSAIAELKKENVIFAMEEPEIAIPPHTQRRIVSYLLDSTNQSFITSHSPYVIERFNPEDIIILNKNEGGEMISSGILEVEKIKLKTYRSKIRHFIAEAILGNAVIIGEGLCEVEVLSIVSNTMEQNPANYPLDLSGVTIFDAGGDGQILKFAKFFKAIGLRTYAFFDYLERKPEIIQDFDETFDYYKQIDYKGIEKLLIDEVSVDIQWSFLLDLDSEGLLPHNINVVPDNREEPAKIKDTVFKMLKGNKGESFAAKLVLMCSEEELPISLVTFFRNVYERNPKPADVSPFSIDLVDSDEEE